MNNLISRQKVLNTLDFVDKACIGEERTVEKYKELLTECIKVLPSASEKSQPKMGQWISSAIQGEIYGQIVKAFICSKCEAISIFRMVDGKIVNGDICPNCRADMRVVAESEDT